MVCDFLSFHVFQENKVYPDPLVQLETKETKEIEEYKVIAVHEVQLDWEELKVL